jgi:hypothetical protein
MFEDLAPASDNTLPEVGNTVQGGFGGQSLDFGRVAQGFVESDANPTIEQATQPLPAVPGGRAWPARGTRMTSRL